jgi:hypothetical protein
MPVNCANCPIAVHIDRDRYRCKGDSQVVRKHWIPSTDCKSYLEQKVA